MRPWVLTLLVLLSVGQVYAASVLDTVRVNVEPPLIYPGEEVNVTFTAENPTDSRHILVIKYRKLPEEFEGPSTTAVLILEPGETESETLRFRALPAIMVGNYFLHYDRVDEAYNSTGSLVSRNSTGPWRNSTGSWWHAVRMYEPVSKLRRGINYNLSMDDDGVNASIELVNSLNRTHRVSFTGKDLEERTFLLKPGDRAKTLFRLDAPALAEEYNFTFNTTEEFYNGTGFAFLYQREYKIEFRHMSLWEKLRAFLAEHSRAPLTMALLLGLVVLWVLRRRVGVIHALFFYLRSKYREASVAASLGILSLSRYLVLECRRLSVAVFLILPCIRSKYREASVAASLGILSLSRYLVLECRRLSVAVFLILPCIRSKYREASVVASLGILSLSRYLVLECRRLSVAVFSGIGEASVAASLGILSLSRYLVLECRRLSVAVFSGIGEASVAASLGILSLYRYFLNLSLRRKKLLFVAFLISLIDLLIFIKYQSQQRLVPILIVNASIALAFLAFAFGLCPSNERELLAIRHLREIAPRALIVNFLLLLLLAAYLISFRGEAGARAAADYAFYILVVAVVLRLYQFKVREV